MWNATFELNKRGIVKDQAVQKDISMDTTNLIVSMSPHIRGKLSVERMMLTFIISLAPTALAGIYLFGLRSLITILIAVATAVVVETLIEWLTHQSSTYTDFHAALTGLLVALILPPSVPWWIPVIGAGVAIILGKMVFGGLGNYPFNPVLVAWVVLTLSWGDRMSLFFSPHSTEQVLTPLMAFKEDPALFYEYGLGELFFGNQPGAIGCVCGVAIVIGGLYVLFTKIIRWHIPVSFLCGIALVAAVLRIMNPDIYPPVAFHLITGGTLLAALFLAPEPVTSPVTPAGMLTFGFLAGILTMIIRMWGGHPDGSFYAILVMNAATPLFNKLKPKPFGRR
jgi:electron transport complex protein RnfD